MKKIAVGIIISLSVSFMQPAFAAQTKNKTSHKTEIAKSVSNSKPSIVIIDTAIDPSIVTVQHEVCIMVAKDCPNHKSFMEGPGSASLPKDQLINGFNHGTEVTYVAKTVNPEIDVIFIRVVQRTPEGFIGFYSDDELILAIDWIIKNRKKFNIVSMSYSSGVWERDGGENFCPDYRTTEILIKKINLLKSLNIPSFFPTGNIGDKTRIKYPACLPNGIAVGALDEFENIEEYSNENRDLDFYALGNYNFNNDYIIEGTSFSVAALSALWSKNYKGNYQKTYDYLKSIGTYTENNKIKIRLFDDISK
jgi:hypothetical protein